MKIELVPIGEIKTYPNNAKIHTAEQIGQIKKSIEEFGFNDPIAIWKNGEIIEGHGRYIAACEMGFEKVPVIRLNNLTDDKRKAYAIVHNHLTMSTGFATDLLEEELEGISSVNMSEYGFDLDSVSEFDTGDFYEEDSQKAREVTCNNCGAVFSVDKYGRVIK